MPPEVLKARVNCSCDPAFHLPVLFYFASEGVFACMHCGTVSCSQVIGDDGRGGGESWMATIAVEVPAPALKWLGQWPRFFSSQGYLTDALFLPAAQKFSTPEKLKNELAALAEKTSDWPFPQKLKSAGFPTDSAPEGLPGFATGFIGVAEVLQLPPNAGIDTLCDYAMRSPFMLALLQDTLLNRPDIDDLLCEWITYQSSGMYWYTRNVGEPYFLAFDLIRIKKEASPKVIETLLMDIAQMPVQKNPYWQEELMYSFKLDAALRVIREIPVNISDAIAAVQTLKQRIGDKEVASLKAINQTLGYLLGRK
jgi:hypothetical protein